MHNIKEFSKIIRNIHLQSNPFRVNVSIMFFALLLVALHGCADKNMLIDNEQKTKAENGGLLNGNHNMGTKDITSELTISGIGGITRSPIKGIDENGNTTRAVVLNENYLPVTEGSDFTARIFLVKYEKELIDANGIMDPKKCKLAAGEIKWNEIKSNPGGGVHIDANPQKITLHWVNEDKTPVNIMPGEDWRIVGIIGGAYNPSFKPGTKYTDENGVLQTNNSSKLYYTYVSFNPNNTDLAKVHNKRDAKGRLRVAAAFVTDWTQLTIKEKNKIELRNFNFKAIGTLFHIKVHRNTTLIGEKAHCYRFISSQMSPSGGFSVGITQKDEYNNVGLKLNDPSIANTWYWDKEEDKTKFFWLNQADNGADNSGHSYEFHYIYDAPTMRSSNQNEYDEFYVWGMPNTAEQEESAKLDNMTYITLEKGGAMLGKKHQKKNGNTYYADEWCYGSGGSNEWTPFSLKDKSGQAFNVELQVMYPKFSAKENNKPKYPWPNQLERFAKTNSRTDYIGFSDKVYFNSTGDNSGYVPGHTINLKEFKSKDLKNEQIVANNYMIPSGEQWEIVFPNVVIGNKLYTQDQDWWFETDHTPKNSFLKRTEQEEIFSLEDDIPFPVDDKREKQRAEDMQNRNRFWSFYFFNKSIREIYAIRLDAHKDGNLYGRRYRCAYRYRFINMGDINFRAADDGRVATFDDLKGEGGQPARRMVVQSRWIGNAYVPLDSLQSETWWGPASIQEGDFHNVDCYRVFPCVGYNKVRRYPGPVYGLYLSRTLYDIKTYATDFNTADAYAVRYFHRFTNDNFGRGFDHKGLAQQLPIMAIIKQDYSETGPDSPKNKNVPNYEECIRRKWDKDDSWRKNDPKFKKDLFKATSRR